MDVAVTELPPIYDVYLMQDLSGSFWDDLPNVQAQFSGLFDSLTAIPTLSLVMNINDMFGSNGIYTNSGSSGPNWERATSVELVQPGGGREFQRS